MAKQEINLGSAPNAGDGDPLRTAFNKINENFDELYNSTGGLDLLNITSDIVPSTDNTYNLGSPSKRWQHGYFATGSLYVGDIKLSNDGGTLIVQQVTDAGLVTETPIPNAPGVVTTDRIINGANTFSITATGELELNGSPFTSGSGNTDSLVNGNWQAYLNDSGSLRVDNADTEQNYFKLTSIHNENDTYGLMIDIDNQVGWTFLDNGNIQFPDSSIQTTAYTGSYTPDDTDNWNEPTVNTIQAALDELAARVTALQNYEIDGGNAYTPPQGETIIDGNGA